MVGSTSAFRKKCYKRDPLYLDKRWKRPPLSKKLGLTPITVAITFSQSHSVITMLGRRGNAPDSARAAGALLSAFAPGPVCRQAGSPRELHFFKMRPDGQRSERRSEALGRRTCVARTPAGAPTEPTLRRDRLHRLPIKKSSSVRGEQPWSSRILIDKKTILLL